ncbi:MAG TPA: SAM-dependent methyltransferase [Trebonia sp.]|nr:SAM-dependent methyltransferase [Trebonia sp.]
MTTDQPAFHAAANGGKAGPLPFDTSVANQARIYDYLLGGKDNYAADRAAAEAALKIYPDGAFTARANRSFLGRAVRYLAAEQGIRQFLDVGTGIPTGGNIHQVAQAIAPETRVMYVDYDPIVLAHSRALLNSHQAGATDYIQADVRDSATIIDRAGQLLDLSQPVAVTLVAILHAIPDSDDPFAVVARLLAALPAGSYLAVSHLASDVLEEGTQEDLETTTTPMFQQHFTYRSKADVGRLFTGLDLVDPGIVRLEEWRPDPAAAESGRSICWCAVGRKP